MKYIIQSIDGRFLTHGYRWSKEYPDAKLFYSFKSVRVAALSLPKKGPKAYIWTENGDFNKEQVQS